MGRCSSAHRHHADPMTREDSRTVDLAACAKGNMDPVKWADDHNVDPTTAVVVQQGTKILVHRCIPSVLAADSRGIHLGAWALAGGGKP